VLKIIQATGENVPSFSVSQVPPVPQQDTHMGGRGFCCGSAPDSTSAPALGSAAILKCCVVQWRYVCVCVRVRVCACVCD